jgi:hypothetical protein
MGIEYNQVTWYSKLVAVILFVATFWIGFYFGGAFHEVASVPFFGDTGALDNGPAVPESNQSPVHLGERFEAGNVTLIPTRVVSDSRCPIGVQCVWAGTVTVEADVLVSGENTAGKKQSYEFTLNEPVVVDGYEITLASVVPATRQGTVIESFQYAFQFTVREGGVVRSIDGLPESSKVPNGPTTFAHVGHTVANNPGYEKDVLFFVYEMPGAPAMTKQLVFDSESTCVSENGSAQCIAISAPLTFAFGDKDAVVEGFEKDSALLVRLLRTVSSRDGTRIPPLGALIVSWPSALKLIETCSVSALSQKHSLDVSLKLKDGRMVRTVEPRIDEVIKAEANVENKCGSVVVATE